MSSRDEGEADDVGRELGTTEAGEVAPVELFFDLVYVFAVSQLSHHLLTHPTWTGVAQTVVLYLAVYAAWAYTTWAVALLPTDSRHTRRMLLAVMAVGLVMNAAIPRAFGDAAWAFVGAFLIIHLGRTVWLLRTGLDAVNQEHFRRVLLWFAAAAPLWALGTAATPSGRLVWWACACLVELIGTWTAHPLPGRRLDSRGVDFAGGHLLERGRLFVLVALGETVLTTGTALSSAPVRVTALLSGVVALSGTVAMFWFYFSRADQVVHHVRVTDDPIRAGRNGVYSLMVSVAALIATAVGDERAIAHPTGPTDTTTALLLFGGPALFVTAQVWHRTALAGHVRLRVLIAVTALAIGGLISPSLPTAIAAAVAAVIVVMLTLWTPRESPVAGLR